ncbi:putative bifunctional dTTP/UTP pyrophosphatase/methyltransferase protein [Genypterus blacodes]|uniref:putative bifunctional dTTP/UTP pyrophosphatase/methyltransferase protein n=1 Tax=Genypterus blacodes TaxID=154954 RepID=UPI003F76A10B
MVLNPVISKLAGKLVVLASESPRRMEILTNVGLRFQVVPSWFKETLDKKLFKAPYEYAVETAKQKALEVATRMLTKHLKTPDIVIGADTIVSVDGLILEKPMDKQDAYRMLSRLSGKEHSVFTGVAIVACKEKTRKSNVNTSDWRVEGTEYEIISFYEETKVKFSDLSEEMLWEYINSGEPMDKAGGYGIQALGGMLVEYVHGDFLNVVGFPLNHFCKQLGLIYNSYPPSVNPERASISLINARTLDNSLSKHSEDNKPKGSEGTLPLLASRGCRSTESDPNKEELQRVIELMDGFKASKVLFTASKMCVFDLLHRRPGLGAAEVAEESQSSLKGTECLLEACVSLGLLKSTERSHQKPAYENTELAKRFLRSDAPFSLHSHIQHCNDTVWPLFSHLESAVQEGTNQHEKAFGKKTKDVFQDGYYKKEDVKLRFMKAMHSVAKVTGKAVATAFDLSSYKTACDLGGCTGAVAYELTKAHPGLSVTVLDLPAVIEMSDQFHPPHTDSRVSFLAGDFLKDELPKADLYILARILHDLPDEKLHVLLDKVAESCTPGCGLLVSEIFLDEERKGPSRALLQALSMSEGRQRSATEYSLLLKSHGFTTVHVTHTDNLLDALLCVKE